MRLWSINPAYLDSKGLVACWREALLAKNVLEGKTKGYKNHPQLLRFKNSMDNINRYLVFIWAEAKHRGYNFDSRKIDLSNCEMKVLTVTEGQLVFEINHLMEKLWNRDFNQYRKNKYLFTKLNPHPLFRVIKGDKEPWERG